ncbi:putative type II DNA modification enzyme [Cellulomonas flavigena DSM 20109]|uniref:site-specific DNA-methyltransferase (adenine-specific) n=1 Tax=Cellulomonas flavigena (strain ATCC 482 / DSM 20109 / BCRC 11376 / JCM 18109 / NBRC 3775 / NCIMB 8073 / NRS 134) TaxID=446466 RepID=D5UC18_CELFN|nr:N-6 DNA methylase [Cellulomonas flavigena]ADG76177.1 putative type II DNA modification enzyme [Cellulomonas flavigena DSM 20109]
MSRDLTAVRSVGALLPSDLLSRVAAGDPDLGGFSGRDYHLAAGESPREAANRAWAYLVGVWPSFQDALARLPEGDAAVGLTRERWLQVLFRELGYGRLQTTPAGGISVAGKAFPVSHAWGAVPIHLLGWGVDLDKRTKGVPGAAERAPHAMVQELLNRSDDHLWAVVSNGRVLRLLRDSTSLSTQSYVEFDLEAIFTGELFADFVVLFLLLHQSRVEVQSEGAPPSDCWLEKWRSTAIASGARALTLLSDGVQRAIADLGTGFLRAPQNTALRARLDDESLHLADYHQALLRLVYRLLFLFVAEDRQALHPADADPVARARYVEYFSTTRLRRLALRRRGTRHGDLWQAQRLVLRRLGQDDGCPELALPGLGGIFDDDGTELFTDAELPNDALLSAVRHLSTVRPKGQPLRTVDYKNLGAEELGSIYESLLELVPRYQRTEQTFSLENLAGNDRKTTGSYYTPSSLIDLVLDETLTPLLDEAERKPDPEAALLAMSVCDPACGSGHFLVAAARRIAERLAIVRSGEIDPTPTHLQDALYDVVGSCIYGVDLNPLAAELAKVSLWLESMRPGRPLSFLDAHIKVGNALLGTTPALLADGIPDDAYVALTGDDKPFTTALKKRNKAERESSGDGSLFDLGDVGTSTIDLRGRLSRAVAPAVGAPRLREVHAAQRAYSQFQASPELARERLHADAWCTAFVQTKRPGTTAITSATLDAVRDGTAPDDVVRTVQRLTAQFRFFHWHLEFPDVFDTSAPVGEHGWAGGFTVMVGNPPWERIKLQEQEFFAQRDALIAGAANSAARKKLIAALTADNPGLADEWAAASRAAEAASHYLRKSGRYPLCGVGDVNTYSVFAELFRSSIAHHGRMGIITPTGLATDATTAAFFADTVSSGRLAAFYDFENEAKIFENVHHAFRFAVACLTGGVRADQARLSFLTRHVADAVSTRFGLDPDEILALNPNTGTLPMFRSRRDAEITLGIYRRHPVLVNDASGSNPWGLRFSTMFHMSNDSGLFETADDLRARGAEFDGWAWTLGTQRWLPLYEAKMLSHYDHRYSTYANATQAQLNMGTLPRLTDAQHDDPHVEPLARYWVAEKDVETAIAGRWDRDWFLGWRDIARSSDARTFVPSVLPRSAVGDKFLLAWPSGPAHSLPLQAIWSSHCFDYIARQKLSGTGMKYFLTKQLAAPLPEDFDQTLRGVADQPLLKWITPRVVALCHTSSHLAAYANDFSESVFPFRWVPGRREQLRAELDAAMFLLYGLDRGEVEHVMDSFFVVRKYEERDHGEFRTKRLILEAYDAMTAAAQAGTVYVSPLDPPPGHGPRHDA